MKKGLALLLAASMAVSTFAGAASAATTAQEKFDALKAKGIFTGYEDGSAGLDRTMTRAEAATIAFRLLKLEEDAAGAAIYKDLKGAEWAAGYIGAATKAGILEGRGNGIFDPSAQVTLQELAKIMVEILDLEVDESATAAGADEWAQKYVAAAVKAGVLKESADYTKAATREALVEATYEADQAIIDLAAQATVNANNTVTVSGTSEAAKVSVKIGDAEAVEVEVVDGAFTFTTEKALAAGTHTVTVSAEGATDVVAEVEVKAPDYSVEAVGYNKIQVNLGQPVEDISKLTFAVKKGTVTVNVSKKTLSEDKTSVVLEISGQLTKGDYVVTTTGLAAEALSSTISVEDEKVTKIEFTSDKAAFVREVSGSSTTVNTKKVSVGYKIYNQYNEDRTSAKAGEVTFTAGKGIANGTASAGTLTLEAPVDYVLDEKVSISAVHGTSGTYATAVVSVASRAAIATVEVEKLVNTVNKDKNLEVGGDAAGNFALVLKAKDQYGNDVKNAVIAEEDLIVSVSNPTVATVKGLTSQGKADFDVVSIDGTNQLVLRLDGTLTAGKSQVFLISNTSGNRASFDLEVKDAAKVDQLTLSAPVNTAVAGDKIEIPFSAVDQFGNAITKKSGLEVGAGKSITSLSVTGAGLDSDTDIFFDQDYVNDVAKLYVDTAGKTVTTATQVFVTAITSTGKVAQVSFSLQPNAQGVVVTAAEKVKSGIAVDAETTVKASEVSVLDQYGRNFKLENANLDNHRLIVKTSDNAVAQLVGVAGTGEQSITLDKLDTDVTIKGLKKGTATITYSLQRYVDKNNDGTAETWEDVSNSAYTQNIRVVDVSEINDYKVADIATLYAKPAANTKDYSKAVTVTGLLSDGTEVALPTDDAKYYTVTASTYGVSYESGKFSASDAVFEGGSNKEKAFPVVVTVITKDGTKTILKEVTVSNVAPEVTTVALRTNGIATKESDSVVSVTASDINGTTKTATNQLVLDAVKLTDQYGVEHAETTKFANVVFAKLPKKSDGTEKALSELVAGDSFEVTAITHNGKVITFTVKVK